MTCSSQPTTSTSQGYPNYGPQWQGYDLHRGGYGGSQMFPPRQIQGQGPSSPGAPRVPPGRPENHPANRPTSSGRNPPPKHHSAAPLRPSISLTTKWIQPPVDQWETDPTMIIQLPPLPEMSYDNSDSDADSDDSPDLGSAEGKPLISLKQPEFSLKQFTKRLRQANYSAFNKWKKVWVAGFLE